jgi:seryl-tRNA synthetase
LKIDNDMVDKINAETRQAKKTLEDSQAKRAKLSKQIADIKDRNSHLEKLSKITPNVDAILSERNILKSQVNDLTLALNRIQNKEITHKDILNLQTQLADLETAQNNLLKENNALKEELIQEQRRELLVIST